MPGVYSRTGSMSVHSIIRFEPLPGKEEAFRTEVLRVSKITRAEPGCMRIEVFESLRKPLTFAIHSEWADEASFERHASLPHTFPPSQGADTLSMKKAIDEAMKKLENPNGSSN